MSPTLKSTGGGPICPGIPLGVETPDVWVCRDSEHPRLLMVKLFSKNSNLCDHNPPTSRTDRQTDDMRSQDRALHETASRGKNTDTGLLFVLYHYIEGYQVGLN